MVESGWGSCEVSCERSGEVSCEGSCEVRVSGECEGHSVVEVEVD